jgi:ribonuclease HII
MLSLSILASGESDGLPYNSGYRRGVQPSCQEGLPVGWVIGIDEAGYGPNLGPFVMTAVACRLAGRAAKTDLWNLLRAAVRRAGEADDGRPLVADSKVVYSTARGLLGLERGVLGTFGQRGDTLAGFLNSVCPDSHGHVLAECWYRGTLDLPTLATKEAIGDLETLFRKTSATAGVHDWRVCTTVICPPRFNELAGAAGTKGAVLSHAVRGLLRGLRETLPGEDSLQFTVDKHGGRNAYAAMIQDALPGGAVVVGEEGMDCSRYEVLGLERKVRLTFRPRAEGECLCVALASMASKYLRELLMCEFNSFWQQHVPGLKATAGYPSDAARFLEAIRPAMDRLGISEAALWRSK